MQAQVSNMEVPVISAGEDPDHHLSITSPPENRWEVVAGCCCCGPLARLHGGRSNYYFLRYWHCNPCMPAITVPILALFPLGVHLGLVVPRSPFYLNIISIILVCFFGIMFCWSYYAAACSNPGFLPYNWIETRRAWYSWEELLGGTAVTREQAMFAKDPQNRPPGCSFSTSFGRYVIRADHICGWIANWVGKCNHKQFMLMNMWGPLYAFSLFAFIWGQKNMFKDIPFHILVVELVAGIIEISFGFTMGGMGAMALIDLCKHRTKIQRMRHEKGDTRNYTFEQSMREICGNDRKCKWFIPTPAFDEKMVFDTELAPVAEDSD